MSIDAGVEKRLNNAFKALADPTRRKILELLSEGDKNAGEIADYFKISKPSISHHLSILKNADLVIDERQGQKKKHVDEINKNSSVL